MFKRVAAVIAASLLVVSVGLAKDKTKSTLAPYLLRARTVAVIVDPNAGISIDDPRANQVAQKDVETALLNWGRFEPVISMANADLIIVVRKGSGRVVDQTITDPRQNNRAGVIDPTDNGVSIGAQHGTLPRMPGASSGEANPESPRTQTEIGTTDDSFVVFEGDVNHPLDATPGWRYVAKNGLHSHDVPAVAAFRKALDEAEKAAAKKP